MQRNTKNHSSMTQDIIEAIKTLKQYHDEEKKLMTGALSIVRNDIKPYEFTIATFLNHKLSIYYALIVGIEKSLEKFETDQLKFTYLKKCFNRLSYLSKFLELAYFHMTTVKKYNHCIYDSPVMGRDDMTIKECAIDIRNSVTALIAEFHHLRVTYKDVLDITPSSPALFKTNQGLPSDSNDKDTPSVSNSVQPS